MRRPRFTLRTLLLLTLLVAMLLGWRSSLVRAKVEVARNSIRLQYAERELERARDEIKEQQRPKMPASRVFSGAELDGMYLRDVTISIDSNAFQRASLKNCDLHNATLQAGGAAFQHARFDGANLTNAKLTGGASSFQLATFVGGDLTGAVLSGDAASFQESSFENATLAQARLIGPVTSFQGVNISGAHFEGADLSALNGRSLESGYFKDAPTYDSQTKFPAGFDPVANLWRRVSE